MGTGLVASSELNILTYQPVTASHSQQQEQQEQQQEQQLNMTVKQHLLPKVKTVMQQTTL